MSDAPRPLLLTICDAAHRLSLSRRSIERLVRSGQLPTRKLGRRRMVVAAAVDGLARRDTPVIGGRAAAGGAE